MKRIHVYHFYTTIEIVQNEQIVNTIQINISPVRGQLN